MPRETRDQVVTETLRHVEKYIEGKSLFYTFIDFVQGYVLRGDDSTLQVCASMLQMFHTPFDHCLTCIIA